MLHRARRESIHSSLLYIIVGGIAREFVLSTFQKLSSPGKGVPRPTGKNGVATGKVYGKNIERKLKRPDAKRAFSCLRALKDLAAQWLNRCRYLRSLPLR